MDIFLYNTAIDLSAFLLSKCVCVSVNDSQKHEQLAGKCRQWSVICLSDISAELYGLSPWVQ